jgi:hypothetical protein
VGGPVVLERAGGRWRVVDCEADGRRMLDCIFAPLDTRQRSGDAVVRVVAAAVTGKATQLVLSLRNEGHVPLAIVRLQGRSGRSWRPGWWDQTLVVPAGAERTTRIAWDRPSSSDVRFALAVRGGSMVSYFDVSPRLDGAEEEQAAPARPPRALKPGRPWQAVAVLAAIVALVAAVGPRGWLPGLLLAFGAGFAVIGAQIAGHAGLRAARRAIVFAAVCVAGAAVAWALGR